jgi:hypothetical protein
MKRVSAILICFIISSAMIYCQVKVNQTLSLYKSPTEVFKSGITVYEGVELQIGKRHGDFWEAYRLTKLIGYLHKGDLGKVTPTNSTIKIVDGDLIKDTDIIHGGFNQTPRPLSVTYKFAEIGSTIMKSGEYHLKAIISACFFTSTSLMIFLIGQPELAVIVFGVATIYSISYSIAGYIKLKTAGELIIRYSEDL